MKITIIGAAGVRTPLIVQAMIKRQEVLGLEELALMDIDGERLEVIGALTSPLETSGQLRFRISRTIDARAALRGADFVITTFRVGGIESRVIDERIPLSHGLLGQETTGPGGFAMGLRSIPVLLEYVALMRELCPQAWLINFANPAGMMAEALVRAAGWERMAGICDAPSQMQRVAAAILNARPDEVYLDYFGLNHLGWVRRIVYEGQDYLPKLIEMIRAAGGIPGLPFDPQFIAELGMIPNEYLYYYYSARQAVENISRSEQSRGEQIAELNQKLFAELKSLLHSKSPDRLERMQARYSAYLNHRNETYMASETGRTPGEAALDPKIAQALEGEGYAGVALDLIEGLTGSQPRQMILNIPNRGAIHGMEAQDVVEIPALVSRGFIHPLAVGEIPASCLGLMKSVKEYEKLTISAAVEKSYSKALMALSIHPLVLDRALAGKILEEYVEGHGRYFPQLK